MKTLNLTEKELELLECAMYLGKAKWFKEASNAIDGNSDFSTSACLRRAGEYEDMLAKIEALMK